MVESDQAKHRMTQITPVDVMVKSDQAKHHRTHCQVNLATSSQFGHVKSICIDQSSEAVQIETSDKNQTISTVFESNWKPIRLYSVRNVFTERDARSNLVLNYCQTAIAMSIPTDKKETCVDWNETKEVQTNTVRSYFLCGQTKQCEEGKKRKKQWRI